MELSLTQEQFMTRGKIFLHPESVGEIRDQQRYDGLVAGGFLEAHESGVARQYGDRDKTGADFD
jgi:hypothetical protein